VTIAVLCPHCETTFQLQPDLAGKTIRCPNFDCREPFEVTAAKPPAVPVDPPPLPPPTVSLPGTNLADFLPVLPAEPGLPYERVESEIVSPLVAEGSSVPVAKRLPAKEPVPVARRLPSPEELPEAKLLPPVPVAVRLDPPAGPKEVAWSADADLPPPPMPTAVTVRSESTLESANEPLLFRRKKSRNVPQIILASLIVGTFAAALAAFGWWFVVVRHTEANLAKAATEAYENGNYAAAGTQFEELAKDYPTSADAPRYSFLSALAKLRATAAAVTAKETPGPGTKAFDEFVKANGGHPLAKPDGAGFARDIYETGRQVIDSQAGHAELKLAEFRSDRKDLAPLDRAEAAIAEGRKLLPALQPFKVKDAAPTDPQAIALDKASATAAFERNRLALFAPYRDLVAEPTDERIEAFEKVLQKNRLDADAEGLALVADAKAELRKRVVAVAESLPSQTPPADGDPGVAFASAVEAPPAPPGSDRIREGPHEVVFAVNRGVLYALDADAGGTPLWVSRVAAANADPKSIDLPVRASPGEGGQELAVFPVRLGDRPGLAARVAATGEPAWFQPLPAAVVGRPVILKDRVYVALADANGTVVEIDLGSGTRVGSIPLRQPIGTGPALFPGTGLLYVPAAARRVFVLDVNARDADGRRLPPTCVQILATEHPPGGLLCEPVPVGPPGRTSEQRYLVVAQSENPTSMKLRAFALPEVVANRVTNEVALAPVAELAVPGWVAFPPTTDGERVSVVTDAGRLAVFGVNQVGNLDRALFALPVPDRTGPGRELSTKGPATDTVPRGQVVLAEEDGFWVVAGGELTRLKLGLDAANGLRLNDAVVPARAVGEPLTRPQVNARHDLAVIVVRNPHSFGGRALAFDPRSGVVKWQRQLGAVPASSVIRLHDGSAVVADEDGGVTVVPAAGGAPITAPAPPAWNAAKGLMAPTAPPLACATADGNAAWVLAPERPGRTATLRVRRVGASPLDASVALPANLAGCPLALGDAVLVPLADGIVYRFAAGTSKLRAGPSWRNATAGADAVCHLSATTKPDEFFGTDGDRKFARWAWPAGETDAWKALTKDAWEALGTIPFPPVSLSVGSQEMVIVADPAGVTAYAANAPSEPLRRWKPGAPAKGFALAGGRVAVAVETGHVFGLDPASDAGAWEFKPVGGPAPCVGLVAVGGRVYATDLYGRVAVLDGKTGMSVSAVSPSLTGLVPTDGVPAVPLGPGRLLLPLADGTAVFLLTSD
jgi:outer membrane protein assembly factor BamB